MFSRRSNRQRVVSFTLFSMLSSLMVSAFANDDIYFIEHKATKNRMHVCAAPHGTPVSSGSSNSNDSCVHWLREAVGDHFFIRSVDADSRIRPDTDADGSPISIQPNDWTGNWVQWSYEDRGDGYGHLINRGTGKLIFMGSTVGENIEQRPSSWRGDFTRFAFERADATTNPTATPTPIISVPQGDRVFIQNRSTGNRMQACAAPEGTPVSSRPTTNTGACVQWVLAPNGEFFFIESVDANSRISPDSAEDDAFISLRPITWSGNWVQWSYEDRGEGFGHIINRGTGKQIFLSARDRANIQQQPSSWRGALTQWAFVRVGGPALPTATPTIVPVETPTVTPSITPTIIPTATPTIIPTVTPTLTPTAIPTSLATPGSTIVEAESGVLSGTAATYSDLAASGGTGVGFLNTLGASVTLNNVPAATSLVVFYASQNSGAISLKVNGADAGNIDFSSNGAWVGSYTSVSLNIDIASGSSVQIVNESGDVAMNIDYVQFVIDGPTPTPGPRTPTPTPSATPEPVVATVNVASSGDLGNFLVAGPNASQPGFTLYTFVNDAAGPSVCNGNCASTWPPYTVASADEIIAPPGVVGLGTQPRQDGSLQVALNGEPLYFYAPDGQPGDTLGHGQGNVWFVADIPVADFSDTTWEEAAVPACPGLYQPSNVPTFGFPYLYPG